MIALLILGQVIDWLFTVGSVLGLVVLEYGVLEGICMVWDKIIHGVNIIN